MSKIELNIEELWTNNYNRPDRKQPHFHEMGYKHEATARKLIENPDTPVEELALYDFMMSRPYALIWGRPPGITRVRRYLSKYRKLVRRILDEGFHGHVVVTKVEDKLVIKDGHRRLNITRVLGMKTIPAVEV